MRAHELLAALERKLGTGSQSELALALGVSVQTLINWRNRDEDLSPLQLATAIAKSRLEAVRQAQYETIRPIVEFYRIERCLVRSKTSWQLFPSGEEATKYVKGLRQELETANGIYIFYDSRGRSLYVGKAREQTLWREMNLTFNRKREIQKIALVSHPERNQEFRPGHEKLRQPKDTRLELYDLAAYFSAYSVDAGMIDDVEALLVRGFANDLLNVKMETFAHTKR